ncbi:hypothetical protein HK101_005410, partial [Irineochytrium annulatum]
MVPNTVILLAAAFLGLAPTSAVADPVTVQMVRRNSTLPLTARLATAHSLIASRFPLAAEASRSLLRAPAKRRWDRRGGGGPGPADLPPKAPAPAPSGGQSNAGLSGSSLRNSGDLLYSVPVSFGSGQSFYLDIDTGSSDTWVRGPKCVARDGGPGCQGAKFNTQDPAVSDQQRGFALRYGSGSVAAEIYQGDVSVGSARTTGLLFGVTTEEEGMDGGSEFDGILGLAFTSISAITRVEAGTSRSNFFDSLQLPADSNRFGIYLSFTRDNDAGEITFGGDDSSKYSGSLSCVPLVQPPTYWQFSIQGGTYTLGSQTHPLDSMVPSAIADSGTSLLILSSDAASAINSAIGARLQGDGNYYIDCGTVASLPSLTFNFGGISLALPASSYILEVDNGVTGSKI